MFEESRFIKVLKKFKEEQKTSLNPVRRGKRLVRKRRVIEIVQKRLKSYQRNIMKEIAK